MIGAGVLAENKNSLRLLEILQAHGAFADADGGLERGAAGFVAHVRAVGQVVGAKPPGHELVQIRGLIHRAAGCVKDRFVGRRQCVQFLGDQAEGVVPGDRFIMRGALAQDHRFGEAALQFVPVIGLCGQLGD